MKQYVFLNRNLYNFINNFVQYNIPLNMKVWVIFSIFKEMEAGNLEYMILNYIHKIRVSHGIPIASNSKKRSNLVVNIIDSEGGK